MRKTPGKFYASLSIFLLMAGFLACVLLKKGLGLDQGALAAAGVMLMGAFGLLMSQTILASEEGDELTLMGEEEAAQALASQEKPSGKQETSEKPKLRKSQKKSAGSEESPAPADPPVRTREKEKSEQAISRAPASAVAEKEEEKTASARPNPHPRSKKRKTSRRRR